MTVIKEKSMRQKRQDREITHKEYREYCTLQKNIKKEKSIFQKWKDNEITNKEYSNYKSQKKGFKDNNEYIRNIRYNNGKCKPMSENKKCSLFLGVHIAERNLSNVFKSVIRMPFGNHGYDFICDKGYKIEVKSACLCNLEGRRQWRFRTRKNQIADYFLFLAFDNREDLNPTKIWLIKSTELVGVKKKVTLNSKNTFGIFNTKKSLDIYSKYELTDKLEKLKECCDTLKNKEE